MLVILCPCISSWSGADGGGALIGLSTNTPLSFPKPKLESSAPRISPGWLTGKCVLGICSLLDQELVFGVEEDDAEASV